MTPGKIVALVWGCIKRTAYILLRRTWQCGDELTIKFHVFTRHQRGEGLKTRATFWGLSSLSWSWGQLLRPRKTLLTRLLGLLEKQSNISGYGRHWTHFLIFELGKVVEKLILLPALLNLVGLFVSIRPRWSGGNDLYHSCISRGNIGWFFSGKKFLPNCWRYKALAGYSGLWTPIQRFFPMKTQSSLRTIQILEKCLDCKMMLDYLVPGLFSTNALNSKCWKII